MCLSFDPISLIGQILFEGRARDLGQARFRLNQQVIDGYLFSRTGTLIYRHRVPQLVPALAIQVSIAGAEAGSVAVSDLDAARSATWRSRPASRWHRLTGNLRQAARDARYFAGDLTGLLGPRVVVPFAP